MMFTRQQTRIGPEGYIFKQLFTISNGGKTNINNNLVFTSALPHRNPLLCTLFSRGLLLIYRWRCMGEAFPDLLKYDDYMSRYVLRSIESAKSPLVYSKSYDIHKALHTKHGVCVQKVLHQGRREGESNADDGGVDLKDIGRMAHTLHSEQLNSYILNVPMRGLLHASGNDPDDRINCIPPDRFTFPSQELKHKLLPPLAAQKAAIAQALVGMSGAEAKAQRLICARETAAALDEYVSIVLSRAASRPRGADNRIIWESDSVYKLFPYNPVFQLDVFTTDEWKAYVCEVREEERRRGDVLSDHERKRRAALDPQHTDPSSSSLNSPAAAKIAAQVVNQSASPIANRVATAVIAQNASAVEQATQGTVRCLGPVLQGVTAGMCALAESVSSSSSNGSVTTLGLISTLRGRLPDQLPDEMQDHVSGLLDQLEEAFTHDLGHADDGRDACMGGRVDDSPSTPVLPSGTAAHNHRSRRVFEDASTPTFLKPLRDFRDAIDDLCTRSSFLSPAVPAVSTPLPQRTTSPASRRQQSMGSMPPPRPHLHFEPPRASPPTPPHPPQRLPPLPPCPPPSPPALPPPKQQLPLPPACPSPPLPPLSPPKKRLRTPAPVCPSSAPPLSPPKQRLAPPPPCPPPLTLAHVQQSNVQSVMRRSFCASGGKPVMILQWLFPSPTSQPFARSGRSTRAVGWTARL